MRRIHEQLATLRDMPEVVNDAVHGPVRFDITPPHLDTKALPAPAERTRRAPAATRAQGLAASDLAGKLEHLSGSALDRAGDLLEMDISDDGDEKFGEKVRGLNSVIKTVLQTQVRVDEHRLKARSLDVLPELLDAIKQEEARRKVA